MKHYVLLVCIVLAMAVIVGIVPAHAANLLINPGFENGLNDWDELWGFPSELSTDPVHKGKFAASKQVVRVDSQDYWSQIYQDIPVTAGKAVYAKIYAMSTFNPLASARAGIMLQFLNANGAVIGSSLNSGKIGGNTAWRLLEVSTKSAPAGAVKVRLSGFIWAAMDDTLSVQNGRVYFDDAYLDHVYRAPSPQTVLYNRGFENGLNDWTDIYGAPGMAVKNTTFKGMYAARKKVDAVAARDYWSQLHQDVTCPANQKIRAILYAKTIINPAANAKAGLQVEIRNAANKVLKAYVTKIGGKTDWRKMVVNIPVTPVGTAKIRFTAYIYAPQGDNFALGGSAFYDNASLSIQDITALSAEEVSDPDVEMQEGALLTNLPE